mgnify:CR=1 FL=1
MWEKIKMSYKEAMRESQSVMRDCAPHYALRILTHSGISF